ncbi:SWIM zinc finger family protein, partial [Limobrevibacterium gyesilva]
MIGITHDDIGRAVSGKAFDAGLLYHVSGRVLDCTVSPGGDAVTGRVRGNAHRPYRQDIRIGHGRDGRAQVDGDCSCPVGYNCKHVAAVLHAAIDQQRRLPVLRDAPALSPLLAAWLVELEGAEADDGEAYPAAIRQRLFYVLRLGQAASGRRQLIVEPTSVALRKDDSFSARVTKLVPGAISQAAAPKYLRNADHPILAGLRDLAPGGVAGMGEPFPDTLHRMIATGRARWGGVEGPAVTLGAPRPGRIAWRMGENGEQRAELELEDGLLGLALAEPWYVDPAAGVMGPVALDLPRRLARLLLAAPAVAPDAAPLVRAEMARRLPA